MLSALRASRRRESPTSRRDVASRLSRGRAAGRRRFLGGLLRRRLFALILAAVCAAPAAAASQPRTTACRDRSTPVYFRTESAEISTTAAAVLSTALSAPPRCRLVGAIVVGRGDAQGPGRSDPGLARRRAQAVAERIVASSPLSARRVQINAKPANATPRRVLERRVTVHLDYAPAV
jgi:outer membrane protein OmpA-like peptidoglycan-associated protein